MKKTYNWIYQSIGPDRREQMKKTYNWISPVPVDQARSAEDEELSTVAQSRRQDRERPRARRVDEQAQMKSSVNSITLLLGWTSGRRWEGIRADGWKTVTFRSVI
jgi:hypothetical protein